MPDLKFCTYCSKMRPADEGRILTTGRGSKLRKKWKCGPCLTGSAMSQEDRDKAGVEMSAESKARASRAQSYRSAPHAFKG
jgi:hypothetical protein